MGDRSAQARFMPRNTEAILIITEGNVLCRLLFMVSVIGRIPFHVSRILLYRRLDLQMKPFSFDVNDVWLVKKITSEACRHHR